MQELFINTFPDLIESGVIRFAEPLSEHCSFKIGGPATVFCSPVNVTQFTSLLLFTISHHINYFILGKGSNLLISDAGFDGVVVHTQGINKISHDLNYISAFCGASLEDLCNYARVHGLSGLEFAYGIPGSVGGAVYMNAGAYGGEIRDVLYCSKYVEANLEALSAANPIKHLKAIEHAFAYRSSAFQNSGFIHLSSVFKLHPDDPELITERMRDIESQRWSKQPMDLPSGGSVFKRPAGYFTGKLVDDCGLRGFHIGGAAVSDKHCGFIVNLGGATASDVMAVIKHVQDRVFASNGVRLELELRVIGQI